MSTSVTECDKCLPRGGKSSLTLDAVCDLAPMKGYRGPCALKFEAGIIDQDDGEKHDKPEKPRKGKAKPNARVRAERRTKNDGVDSRRSRGD